jgi:hypothetical protein
MTIKHLPVICGENTCYNFEEKVMCRFVRSIFFGTRWHCTIYHICGDQGLKENQNQCLLRDPQCVEEIK